MAEGWIVEERRGTAAELHAAWPATSAAPESPAVAICQVTGRSVVLGSTQAEEVVDGERALAAGISVARRQSGGGAVLVGSDDPVWVDLWVPTADPRWHGDVSRAFDWVGDAWVTALRRLGEAGWTVHRGGALPVTRWASLVCFGGVGTGEVLTGSGQKVVGVAQRRTRQGSWFHSACVIRWDPASLVGVLDMSAGDRAAAVADLGHAAAGVGDALGRSAGAVDAGAVASAFVASLPAI